MESPIKENVDSESSTWKPSQSIESLFRLLESRLSTLCLRVKEVDPSHTLAEGNWQLTDIDYSELRIEMIVSYIDGPSMHLEHDVLTEEGIDSYVEGVALTKQSALDREEARLHYEKERRREDYFKLKDEFEGE